MAIIRDDQGRLVVDGKIIPKHEEQLYLRRTGNNDFPSKSQFDKANEEEIVGLGQDIIMAGGEVDHLSTLKDKELPDHPESRVPDKLREPAEATAAEGYSFMGVKLDPGEDAEDEPIEEGPTV